jgi:hypothetical protein
MTKSTYQLLKEKLPDIPEEKNDKEQDYIPLTYNPEKTSASDAIQQRQFEKVGGLVGVIPVNEDGSIKVNSDGMIIATNVRFSKGSKNENILLPIETTSGKTSYNRQEVVEPNTAYGYVIMDNRKNQNSIQDSPQCKYVKGKLMYSKNKQTLGLDEKPGLVMYIFSRNNHYFAAKRPDTKSIEKAGDINILPVAAGDVMFDEKGHVLKIDNRSGGFIPAKENKDAIIASTNRAIEQFKIYNFKPYEDKPQAPSLTGATPETPTTPYSPGSTSPLTESPGSPKAEDFPVKDEPTSSPKP